MTVQIDRLPPDTRQRVEKLMSTNGWSFDRAINEMIEESIANGALSEVGKRKAKVLQLVPLKRASARDSSG